MSSLRDECSVCLSPLIGPGRWNHELANLVSTPCGHVFHAECFRNWYRRGNPGNSCPLCRRRMNLTEAVPLRAAQPRVTGNQRGQKIAWMSRGGATMLTAIIVLIGFYVWDTWSSFQQVQREEQLQRAEEKLAKIRNHLDGMRNILNNN